MAIHAVRKPSVVYLEWTSKKNRYLEYLSSGWLNEARECPMDGILADNKKPYHN